MEIPVFGFMYHSDDSDPMHSHRLYITSWNGSPVSTHIHEFKGVTSYDAGHDHSYAGTTEPAPSGIQHTHRYFTFTSIDDRHNHQIHGITGPAIPLPGGGPYHEFSGVTTVNGTNPHRHRYRGRTSL